MTLLFVAAIHFSAKALKTDVLVADVLNYISGILYATGDTIAWVPLWFLPNLFISSCVALLTIKVATSFKLRLILIVTSLWVGVYILKPDADLPWSIDLLPISLAFILIGYLCSDLVKSMIFNKFEFLLGITAFFLLHIFFNETINLNWRHYGNFLVSTLQALLGIFLCLSISSYLARFITASRVLEYIGSGSLFILLFHYAIQEKAFNFLMRQTNENLFAFVSSFTAGVVLPLMLLEIVKRSNFLRIFLLPRQTIAPDAS